MTEVLRTARGHLRRLIPYSSKLSPKAKILNESFLILI
jgi:hypothetical protein